MLNTIRHDLSLNYPRELIDSLIDSYIEIKENYLLERHEPSELNGGKFVEAIIRVLQCVTNNGQYVAIGTQIRDMIGTLRAFEQLPASSCLESFRIHIPRSLAVIYNIRNKRGVGHLGGDVNPNLADSTLIVAVADWILAELFRINYGCNLDDAQKLVNNLVQRKIPLVHEFEDMKRVLNPKLTLKNQTLLILATAHPNRVPEIDLFKWIEPSNITVFRRDVLRSLHKIRHIDYIEKQSCLILPTGLSFVESSYEEWNKQLERRKR